MKQRGKGCKLKGALHKKQLLSNRFLKATAFITFIPSETSALSLTTESGNCSEEHKAIEFLLLDKEKYVGGTTVKSSYRHVFSCSLL